MGATLGNLTEVELDENSGCSAAFQGLLLAAPRLETLHIDLRCERDCHALALPKAASGPSPIRTLSLTHHHYVSPLMAVAPQLSTFCAALPKLEHLRLAGFEPHHLRPILAAVPVPLRVLELEFGVAYDEVLEGLAEVLLQLSTLACVARLYRWVVRFQVAGTSWTGRPECRMSAWRRWEEVCSKKGVVGQIEVVK